MRMGEAFDHENSTDRDYIQSASATLQSICRPTAFNWFAEVLKYDVVAWPPFFPPRGTPPLPNFSVETQEPIGENRLALFSLEVATFSNQQVKVVVCSTMGFNLEDQIAFYAQYHHNRWYARY